MPTIAYQHNPTQSVIRNYKALLNGGNVQALAQLFLDLITTDDSRQIALPHPERPDINTYCRDNHRFWMSNILTFSDSNNENVWCLIQDMNLIDAIYIEGVYYSLYLANEVIAQPTAEYIENTILASRPKTTKAFGGILLGQNTPFHFFYDQLTCLSHLHTTLGCDWLNSRSASILVDKVRTFFLPTYLDDYTCATADESAKKYYLFPNFIGGIELLERNPAGFARLAGSMELRISQEIVGSVQAEKADLVGWFGITGQKRKWIEQVDACVSIFNELAEIYPKVCVILDGMTAPEGQILRCAADEAIAAEIKQHLSGRCEVYSLIGLDYKAKIAYGKTCDFFISNGGSGSIVPMRFCGLPGVVHSIPQMNVFMNEPVQRRVRYMPAEKVRARREFLAQRDDSVSYSIDWEDVYQEVLSVLPSR